MADSSSEGTLANVSKYSQSSILTHLETLDGDDRSALLSSLSELDFEGIFDRHVPSALNSKAPDSIQPFPEDNCVDLNDDVSTSSQSVVSPCIMAGGAGTRLGFDGPKGCYSLIRNKTLYDFLIPRCATNCLKTGAPVLIMTSPVNHEETVDWFRKREWYKSHGLEESAFILFKQDTLPSLSSDLTASPQILLSSATTLTSSPNGNGGIFTSLFTNAVLGQLTSKNVTGLHVFGIDNLLTRPCDPSFISAVCGSPCGNKTIKKTTPDEKIGVMATDPSSKTIVIEYSDLSSTDKELTKPNGDLVYGLGNICSHYFSLKFLNLLSSLSPTYHVARKNIDFYDPIAKEVKKCEAVKLETFVFDVFKEAEKVEVVSVSREDEFAPIKNKEGSDSRETALRLLTNLWKKRVGGEGLENVDVLDIEGWEGNEEKVREEVKRRAGEGETVITVWEREWE
ncbi:hypothetical protein TrST_g12037 [Triparma strigata]|uniref:UDP-N-acetylglucosamine diphosphorylase n=1 Tax=Triparma strigata TaxID=1606541 RepID=A0A9W7A0L2_9STRA|nr:hypothetical protein TrST_g12037 [Triparma strigata]